MNWKVKKVGVDMYAVMEGNNIIASVYSTMETNKPFGYNANLIAASPVLLEEHKHWSKIQGRIIVEALQGNFEYLKLIARTAQIEYINGEPYLKSEAIAKATP